MIGKVLSINISTKKGTKKTPVTEAVFVEDFGIQDDAHGGDWHRQISLLDQSSVDKIKELDLNPGDFAENITTENLDLYHLELGTIFYINDVKMELTQIGKECHNSCMIKKQVGDCVMPREGVFVKVLKGGTVRVGDMIKVGDEIV